MRGARTATSMMRVRDDLRVLLQRLADEDGVNMQELLSRALEEYRRARLFERADAAYAALRSNQAAWQEERDERAAWDATLLDGMERTVQSQDHALT
jgi:predicted kinase